MEAARISPEDGAESFALFASDMYEEDSGLDALESFNLAVHQLSLGLGGVSYMGRLNKKEVFPRSARLSLALARESLIIENTP